MSVFEIHISNIWCGGELYGSGVYPVSHQEVLLEPSVGSVLMLYHLIFSIYLIPQLQLWHLHRLVSAQCV